MELNKYKYGVNMRKWVQAHENYIEKNIDSSNIEEILSYHEKKLSFLQHERLIHLLVTILTAGVELFAIFIFFILPEGREYASIFVLGILILLGFYFRHYFFLENTVQKWYMIYEKLHEIKIDKE